MRLALVGLMAFLAAVPGAARRSPVPGAGSGRLVVVKMVDQGGGQYRFAPGQVTVAPGDTVRWEEASDAPHNVQFDSWPHGARPGSAQVGPLLTAKGATYQLVIDGRFPPGTYTYECTPHGSLGMKATLTVVTGGA